MLVLISSIISQANAQSALSDILRKVASPEPGEEIFMYAGIVVCIAVLYVLYSQLTQKKTEFADQLTMADVVKDSKGTTNELSEEDKLL